MLDFQTNNYNFPVEEQPVYTKDMKLIPDHKCIVRTDTGATLGMHGSRYKLVTHDDTVNSMIDAFKASRVTNDYEVTVSVTEDGRKMRGEILCPDLIQEPSVGDITQFRISFLNSYDGTRPLSQQANGLRLTCLNGQTSPEMVARSRFKHTASINIDGSAAKVVKGAEYFMTRASEWQSWMQTRLNDDQVEQFFRSTICKVVTKQKQVEKTNEKQLENLISGWDEERATLGANKWALYNCLTHWATHTEDLKSPEAARYNREISISNAMNHNLFKSMTGFNVV